ncbi:MAG: molybdopterin molybdotransferase MoeA [Deltaproteobacteria bacterium]|nr:molybdopterin molybdotransferase MoeA [Deltaproteobacteria bacterium]
MSPRARRPTAPDPHTGGPSRFQLVAVAEALAVLRGFRPVGAERIPVADAPGRVLARDVRTTLDLPHFERSYMDGFAVRARDTADASAERPARLAIVGSVRMGHPVAARLRRGECMRIPTGGMLPAGADAVVMVEHTTEAADDAVDIERAARAGQHVMRRGEDARKGARIFPRGRRLRPADVGALSGVGLDRVWVVRRPRVAVLATGDEIVPPHVTPRPGQVRNVNQYALRALIAAAGCEPVDFGVLPDREAVIRSAMRRALARADAVLVSGGSSVGTKDLTPAVVAAMPRARILVHGVRIKPGKPTLIARAAGKPVIGLPGNPTSALVIFHVFALPLLRLLGGEPRAAAFAPRRAVVAELGERLGSLVGREDWIRVALVARPDGTVAARPVAGGSGDIVGFVRADGLVRIPADAAELAPGTPVVVSVVD